MNKIILFVIVLIIGSVLSTGMMEVPEKKDSDSSFQCTIESMKACGNSDKVCLENFMKKCQQHSTEEKTINVSYNHKNHHTYKTSIIVKEHHTTTFEDDDSDEDDDSKRICITDNNCNCKDLAETSCQNDQSKESCVANFVKDCNDRCRESRRCYRMDCSNAGHRRCTDDVQIECALEFTDESKRLSCVQEKTACCKRYELATCKRALRVYQYRTDCQTQSQKQCFGINDEKQKCTCIATTRHSCLVDKVQKYRQSVRQVFDCEHSAKTICSEKKCGTEYDECIKRESGRCVPVCTSDNKECAKKWKEENCEKRAAIKCGDDNYCLKAEREICKVQEPKCTNDKSCDDSNKCTEDSCDAVKGCIHKTMNCDDKDECTSDSCDVATGKCTHTPIEKCTKVTVDKCTKQSDCDALNKKLSEECKSAICDTTTQTCKVNVDYKCIDSRVCKKNCVPNSNCEEAVCVYDETLKKHTCKRTQSTDNKCIDKETACKLQCKPANLCETTSCAKQVDGSFTCLRSVNTCNDNKSCTKDSCDVATGKCVNTYVVSEECPQNGNCEKNLDCAQWGLKVELDICLTPVCDTLSGSCKAVPNDNKCSRGTCKKLCPPRNQCEESVCSYDKTTKKIACQYTPKTCDDKNKCTVDTCDNVKGCVNTFDKNVLGCDTPRCEAPKDCVKYAEDNKFADDCKEAICDSETKTCRAVLINNPKCNPYLNKCRRECTPRDACETSTCIVDANTKRYRCERTPITCDDKNACTVDVCDKVKGCKYTYTISDKCEQFCNDNNDCATYGLKKQASLSCQVPYCDKTTSSCRLQEDSNKNCKRVDIKCELACKPQDSCHTARCVRKGDNEFTCVQEPIKCDDGESCTEDSCNAKTGCVFKFKESTTCKKPCKVDIDCDNWAVTEKLADKCQKAFCSRKLGSCVAIKGPQTEKCRTTDQCKVTSDCPQGSKYGSVCCEESGVKQCCEHQCETDLDCVPKDKKKQWGYCKIRDSGKRECEYKDKCKGNEECDDKNPCTKDICITEYGFCKNTRRCVDNTQCTHDICVPGTDGKTYTCKNPTKTCTNDKKLLDKNYDKLTPKDKTRWLGKCSHLEGCVTCVVNAQCDDNNGCTEDSCINQFCVSKPIDNKWCDPKLEGQAITVQGYFPKFTRL